MPGALPKRRGGAREPRASAEGGVVLPEFARHPESGRVDGGEAVISDGLQMTLPGCRDGVNRNFAPPRRRMGGREMGTSVKKR